MLTRAKLDEIDVKLIRALQRDARTNFADIAKDCGVSVDTVSKRFKKLKRMGIARGTTVLLNPKSFGYDCVASFGIRVDYPHVQEVVDFVGKTPEVVFCTPSMGRHNIFAIAVLKNVGRLGQVKESIKGHPMVREVAASIWVDDILLCPENFEFDHLRKKWQKTDETDLAIIEKLTQDARTSFRKIAKKLRMSPDTVINRYAALQKQGVIRGSTIVINPKKIGYQAMAVFMIDTSPSHILATEPAPANSSLILDRLIQMPNIIVATKTVGDHDLLAIGVAIDFEHLTKISDDIQKIPGVKDMQVSFWIEKTELCPKYFVV